MVNKSATSEEATATPFAEIAQGESVFVVSGYKKKQWSLRNVTRRTPTRIILGKMVYDLRGLPAKTAIPPDCYSGTGVLYPYNDVNAALADKYEKEQEAQNAQHEKWRSERYEKRCQFLAKTVTKIKKAPIDEAIKILESASWKIENELQNL